MNWWLIEDFGMPLYLERYCGSAVSALDIADRFVDSDDAVRMRNFCSAIPRKPTLRFDVIGMDASVQVRSDFQSNVTISISPNELRAIDETSAIRLACLIEQHIRGCPSIQAGRGQKITIDPDELASNKDGAWHPFRLVLSGVQSFPELNPTKPVSSNLELLNNEYAFEGVELTRPPLSGQVMQPF